MTTNQQAFYERIGFQENQSTTMVLLNQPLIEPLPTCQGAEVVSVAEVVAQPTSA
jgi:hypothetical protein